MLNTNDCFAWVSQPLPTYSTGYAQLTDPPYLQLFRIGLQLNPSSFRGLVCSREGPFRPSKSSPSWSKFFDLTTLSPRSVCRSLVEGGSGLYQSACPLWLMICCLQQDGDQKKVLVPRLEDSTQG